MSATNGVAVLDRVRAALMDAEEAGQARPGRPALVKLTGATDHQVRRALAELVTPPTSAGGPGDDLVTGPGDAGELVVASTGEHDAPEPLRTTQPRPWPLLVIGLAAAVAVWSGWVGLGEMAGFGVIRPLPGIWDGLRINSAVVLPLSVEAYAAYALRVWLGGTWRSARTLAFARWSAISSLVIGAGAQVAYHLMSAAGYTRAPWPVVMLVSIVPVVVLGLASALAKLVTNDGYRPSWPR